ncbi:hypothetical protein DMENIID0001_140380 [Sergentomyia squamirostris]
METEEETLQRLETNRERMAESRSMETAEEMIYGVEGLSIKPNWIYKLQDIIRNLKLMDESKEPVEMVPYFPEYSGIIHRRARARDGDMLRESS